jgi:hypothetical protein
MRRVAPAIALFFLSPSVAEFLLGDFGLSALFVLVGLAPMYGGAAILIREVARRTGRGWPAMVLLALGYGVLEEGLTTQSLFNPDYLDAHLLDQGFVPALGIAIPWTVFVLAIHTIWSISVPIAVVEEWTDRRTAPWLRTPGIIVVSVIYFMISYSDGHYLASWPSWGAWHRYAAAAGGMLTYAWHSFFTTPLIGAGPIMTPLSHIVFALAAVALLAAEARRIRAREHRPAQAAEAPVQAVDGPAADAPAGNVSAAAARGAETPAVDASTPQAPAPTGDAAERRARPHGVVAPS